MDRRGFFAAAVGCFAIPLAAEAQRELKTPTIGVLTNNLPASERWPSAPFWDRLRELGWVDGRGSVEVRAATGQAERLRSFASELKSLKSDVIVMDNGSAAAQVKDSTRPTPVCVVGGDLQAAGAVQNLARPEDHITGVSVFQPELVGKRVTLLKEAIPSLTRVGMMFGAPRHVTTNAAAMRVAEDVCRRMALQLHVAEVLSADGLEQGFSALARAQVGGALVANNPVLTLQTDRVVALAAKNRLPVIYEYRTWAAAGGLMSYGPIPDDYHRLLAECVDRILRGAKPVDVPVQQPTKFALVINLKTAKALGLTIPPSLLQRADQVIE